MGRNIENVIQEQDKFFRTHESLAIKFRLTYLKKLKQNIKRFEPEIINALHSDLGKSEFEAFSTEIGMVQHELSLLIKKLRKWARPERVSTPLPGLPARSYIHKQPLGRILVISPFNYPFSLAVMPLAGAVSAGNVVVLKPSEHTAATSKILEKLIRETFEEHHVAVVQGGIEESKVLLNQRWDKIFFTGSTKVGKIVLEAAAKHLTPVVLELGGKNPAVIDKDANLKVAAKRIIWSKLINAGQTCIAPDYLYVHEAVKEEFLELLVKNIKDLATEDPGSSGTYPYIINAEAVKRLESLLYSTNVYYGGTSDASTCYFSPTILTEVSTNSPVMQDEIFGPLLPVLGFTKLDEVIDYVNSREKPLAAYYFGKSRKNQNKFLKFTSSGDAGINEVLMHFANLSLPFGGVGYSGMGSYHGKRSFDVFSHERSVVKNSTFIDVPLRYPPAKPWVLKVLRFLFR